MTTTKTIRVLVVEDQMLIAFAMKDALNASGFDCVGPFAKVEEALAAIETDRCDFAFLDINLGDGTNSEPIAEVLMDRNIPFAFLTGYGRSAPLHARFAHIARFQKPIRADDMLMAMKVL